MMKIVTAFFLAVCFCATIIAQPGLEGVVIEKYYIADANDATTPFFPVPNSAVTYRVYVDLAPDWGLQAIFGATNVSTSQIDTFVIRSTQPFFNHEDVGAQFGYLIPTNSLDENTVLLDSWFSTGRASTTSSGVLKPEDTNGGAPAFPNLNGLLQNNDPAAGLPINSSDGNIPFLMPTTWTVIGDIPAELVIFDNLNLAGNEFIVSDGALTSFATPLQGPNATNKVLIGQFTTAGDFSGQLNVQLRNSITGETQQWVAETPGVGQFTSPQLKWKPNSSPVVSILSPSDGAFFLSGQTVLVTAEASDPDSAIVQVEFFFEGLSLGIDFVAPYETNFIASLSGEITAVAIGDFGVQTTSSPVMIEVNPYIVRDVSQFCNLESICVPIEVIGTGIHDVSGFDLELSFDVSKIVPTGNIMKSSDLLPQHLFNTDYTIDLFNQKMLVSIFLNSNAPLGTSFEGTGDIICIEFSKRPAFAAIDSTVVGVNELLESLPGGGVVVFDSIPSGTLSTERNTTFLGSIAFWADHSPIKYDSINPTEYLLTDISGSTVACDTFSIDLTQPDLNGAFVHNLDHGDYLLIDRDIAGTTDVMSVINSFDAFLVRKLLIDDLPYIPTVFEMIAMDVNMDGVISAGDVSQINQRSVLIIDEFRQEWNYDADGTPGSDYQQSRDWLFVSHNTVLFDPAYTKSSTFPADNGIGYSRRRVPRTPCSIWTEVDIRPEACPEAGIASYIGILLGDVNGNYKYIERDGVLK